MPLLDDGLNVRAPGVRALYPDDDDVPPQCGATTLSGQRCKRVATEGEWCSYHAPVDEDAEYDGDEDAVEDDEEVTGE